MLLLKSVEIKESKSDNNVIVFDGSAILKDFNLLISDNAQGKTRFFNTINYMSSLAKNQIRTIGTDFRSKWLFEYRLGKNISLIKYDLFVQTAHGKNIYKENIYKNNKIIFSSNLKILINESNKKRIENFYIPENIPALISITDIDFVTIKLVRDFFQRIVYISSSKQRGIIIEKDSTAPNSEGTNIASVLENWEKNYPDIFRSVIHEFKALFPFILNVYFTEQETLEGMKTKLITFDEKDVKEPMTQLVWSDGLYRILLLIMAAKTPFIEGENTFFPSIVMIDEIENGLDFKRLEFILSYLKDHADESQIMISSHSPLICEFVHPSNWIVLKREGSKINFVSPSEQEDNLESELEIYKQKHWDFYTRHISKSENY